MAEMLGGTADELSERMTCDELWEWQEFFVIRHEEQKKAANKAKASRKR